MTVGTLVVGSMLAFAVAAAFTWVGGSLWGRDVPGDGRHAIRSFAVWAFAITGNMLLMGTQGLLAAAGAIDLPVHVVFTFTQILLLVVGLAGLAYSLLFVLTGRKGVLWAVVAGYAVYSVAFLVHFVLRQPIGVNPGVWRPQLEFAAEVHPAFLLFILGGMVLPQVILAIASAVVAIRVTEPTPRYRTALVSVAVLAWTVSLFLAAFASLAPGPLLEFANRMLAVGAALVVFSAYSPPAWVQRHGVTRLGDPA